MLKDEPKLLYVYECTSDKIGTLDIIYSERNDLDPIKFKLLYTYRNAFVGDMQDQFDKFYQCNNMEKFAKSTCSNVSATYIKYVYIQPDYSLKHLWNIFVYNPLWRILYKLKNFWREKRKHKEERNTYLEDLLFGKLHKQEYKLKDGFKFYL